MRYRIFAGSLCCWEMPLKLQTTLPYESHVLNERCSGPFNIVARRYSFNFVCLFHYSFICVLTKLLFHSFVWLICLFLYSFIKLILILQTFKLCQNFTLLLFTHVGGLQKPQFYWFLHVLSISYSILFYDW